MKNEYLTVEEIMQKSNSQTKSFIENLELDELNDQMETVTSIENAIKLQKNQTEIIKNRFANEIVNGLGQKILENPTVIKVYKESFITKIKNRVKKLFFAF